MTDAALQEFLKTTVIYGLGFVLLAALCLTFVRFLWKLSNVALSVLSTLRDQLPIWFRAQIESHQAVVNSANKLTDSMTVVQTNSTAHLEQSGITQKMIYDLADGAMAQADKLPIDKIKEPYLRAQSRLKEK